MSVTDAILTVGSNAAYVFSLVANATVVTLGLINTFCCGVANGLLVVLATLYKGVGAVGQVCSGVLAVILDVGEQLINLGLALFQVVVEACKVLAVVSSAFISSIEAIATSLWTFLAWTYDFILLSASTVGDALLSRGTSLSHVLIWIISTCGQGLAYIGGLVEYAAVAGLYLLTVWLPETIFAAAQAVSGFLTCLLFSPEYVFAYLLPQIPAQAYYGLSTLLIGLFCVVFVARYLVDRGFTVPWPGWFTGSTSSGRGRIGDGSRDLVMYTVDLGGEDSAEEDRITLSGESSSGEWSEEVEEIEDDWTEAWPSEDTEDDDDDDDDDLDSEIGSVQMMLQKSEDQGSSSVGGDQRNWCVVCQDQRKDVLVMPCRHLCLCRGCATQLVSLLPRHRRVCPLCRTRIVQVIDVYL